MHLPCLGLAGRADHIGLGGGLGGLELRSVLVVCIDGLDVELDQLDAVFLECFAQRVHQQLTDVLQMGVDREQTDLGARHHLGHLVGYLAIDDAAQLLDQLIGIEAIDEAHELLDELLGVVYHEAQIAPQLQMQHDVELGVHHWQGVGSAPKHVHRMDLVDEVDLAGESRLAARGHALNRSETEIVLRLQCVAAGPNHLGAALNHHDGFMGLVDDKLRGHVEILDGAFPYQIGVPALELNYVGNRH